MSTIPSLALIPSGVKASKVYSVLPTDGTGDFDFTRSGNATRVNSEGLIELVSTNVPRLNYPLIDGVVSGCPSLLLEPSKSNNLQRSEEFEDTYWVNNGVTITANQIISPSGLLNADLLTGVSGGFGIVRFSTWTSTNKVASCFAKAGATNIFKIANVSAGNRYVLFDLSNGTVFEQSAGWTGFIENYGNGWYRCTAISNNETGTFSLGVTAASESVYIWGAQLEAGTYSTSYIPTTTTTATRSAETCNNAGDVNTFNDSEGVLFAEISTPNSDINMITISDGSTSNAVRIDLRSAETVVANFAGNGTSISLSLNPTSVSSFLKVAFKYKNNNFALWVNGIEVDTDASSLPALSSPFTELKFSRGNNTFPFYGSTKQIQYFNTALTDLELQQLTTL
jgi:hypothetical protein